MALTQLEQLSGSAVPWVQGSCGQPEPPEQMSLHSSSALSTHSWSQVPMLSPQQNGSTAHTSAAQVPHDGSIAVPTLHTSWSHIPLPPPLVEPQACSGLPQGMHAP
jgi:hypothetical protein